MSRLIEMRLNKGLSIRQAAARMGISRATLASAESGASLHPGTAKTIADFYDVKVTDIWPVTDAGASREEAAA